MTASLPILSPTQIKSAEACPRAYGFKYVDGLQTPETDAKARGTRIHAHIETYYKTGVLPFGDTEAARAISALAYIPKWAAKPYSEHIVTGLSFAGGVFGGTVEGREMRIDIYDPNRRSVFRIGPEDAPMPTHDAEGRPIPLVMDLKSTRDFKYQQSARALRGDDANGKSDAQVAIYARAAIDDFRRKYGSDPSVIQCRWVYILTDAKTRPRARVTDFTMTPQEVSQAEVLWSVDVSVAHFIRTRQVGAAQLPPNLLSCPSYGGCGYGWRGMGVCALSAAEEIVAIMPNDFPGLDLNAKLAQFQQTAAAAMPTTPVAPATASSAPAPTPANFGLNPAAFAPPVPPVTPPVPVAAAPSPPTPAPAAPATDLNAIVALAVEQLTPHFQALATNEKRHELLDVCVESGQLPLEAANAIKTMLPLGAAPTVTVPLEKPAHAAQHAAAPPAVPAAGETPTRRGPGRPKKTDTASPPAGDVVDLRERSSVTAGDVFAALDGDGITARLRRAIAVGLRAAANDLELGQ